MLDGGWGEMQENGMDVLGKGFGVRVREVPVRVSMGILMSYELIMNLSQKEHMGQGPGDCSCSTFPLRRGRILLRFEVEVLERNNGMGEVIRTRTHARE